MTAPPPGPHFDYAAAPGLFLGRRGGGPLVVVWDTNVLVDYLEHGRAMWEGEELDVPDEDYLSELECVQLLIRTAFVRDVRIVLLPHCLTDAKRQLTERRLAGRARAVEQFARAVALLGDDAGSDEDDGNAGQPAYRQAGDAAWSSVREALPAGHDRALVETAVASRAHVFLTRDRAVLARRDTLLPYGLLLASPGDLVEELAACGALLAALSPAYVQWPVPDLQRMSHLVQALGED